MKFSNENDLSFQESDGEKSDQDLVVDVANEMVSSGQTLVHFQLLYHIALLESG